MPEKTCSRYPMPARLDESGRHGLCTRREFLRTAAIGVAAVAAAPLLRGHTAHAAAHGGTSMLIVYFSHSGNTRRLAACIQRLTGGDMAEIRPLTPYPKDYDAVVDMAKQEQRRNARPAIAALQPDPAAYDTLFLGYPSWWGTFPMPVATFLETCPVGSKTLVPFCTHEGSRLGRSVQDLRRLCPQARLLKGFEVRGSRVDSAEPAVKAWLTELGLI